MTDEDSRFRIYVIGLLRVISLYFIIWGGVALIAALGLLAYVSIPMWFSAVCFIYGPTCITLGYFSWKRAADYRSIPIAITSAFARTILFFSSSIFLYRSRIAIDELISTPDAERLLGTVFVYTGISMGCLTGTLLLTLIDTKKIKNKGTTGKNKNRTKAVSRTRKTKTSSAAIEKKTPEKTKPARKIEAIEESEVDAGAGSGNNYVIDPRRYRTDQSIVRSYLLWGIFLSVATVIAILITLTSSDAAIFTGFFALVGGLLLIKVVRKILWKYKKQELKIVGSTLFVYGAYRTIWGFKKIEKKHLKALTMERYHTANEQDEPWYTLNLFHEPLVFPRRLRLAFFVHQNDKAVICCEIRNFLNKNGFEFRYKNELHSEELDSLPQKMAEQNTDEETNTGTDRHTLSHSPTPT